MKNLFPFEYTTQVINPKGKLVYEYNPLYNYRTTGRNVISQDAEGNYLDKNRNVLYERDGTYYYKDKYGIEHPSIPEILEDGMLLDLVTGGTDAEGKELEDVLGFDLTHPISINCLQSYDGSTNLILNDGKNIPRLINTRFTPRENNTYERVDRRGNTDTNIYDYDEFDIDSSLFKRYNTIPKINFQYVSLGGNLKVGNYTFYFKLADGDGNETDFVGESGIVSIYVGALNSPRSIRGGSENENGSKSVTFTLSDIDSAYDYVVVYYVRNYGTNYTGTSEVEVKKITKPYRTNCSNCVITVNGLEATETLTLLDINIEHFVAKTAKTLTICLNMLFLGNVTKADVAYKELLEISLNFFPFYERTSQENLIGCLQYDYVDIYGKYEYYNTQNIYNFVGYWPEELYRFGVVYVMNDNTLSPVFNIRGIRLLPEYTGKLRDEYGKLLGGYTEEFTIDNDTQLINESTLENSAGVVLFPESKIGTDTTDIGNLPIYGIRILSSKFLRIDKFGEGHVDTIFDKLKEYNVKGYFFVRQKRIPTILALAFVMGVDKVSGLPLIYEGKDNNKGIYICETFLTTEGKLEGDLDDRVLEVYDVPDNVKTAICPEYELNQAYYNNLFTGELFTVKQITDLLDLCRDDRHFITTWNNSQKRPKNKSYTNCNIVSVPDSAQAVRCDNFTFRAKAGNPEDITFEYIGKDEGENNLPEASNFSHTKRKKKWLKILKVATVIVAATAAVVATVYTAGAAGAALGAFGTMLEVAPTFAAAVATGALTLTLAGTIAAGAAATTASTMGVVAASGLRSSVPNNDNMTENRVAITRGAYSTYLGITNNTDIKPNLLINIYVPGYLSTSAKTLFDIRINDESPYYPISLRYQIGRDEFNETLYRGDCYISNFTHRINRNFQDPDAPNNDKIADNKTWLDNWKKDKKQASEVNRGDVNAVKMGLWMTFKCYTSMNLALRDHDGSLPEEEGLTGHKRSFYPLSAMSVNGNYKVPDSTTYNASFSVSTGNKMNYILPNVPYIKNSYLTRIMYSHPSATDSFKNGFREFDNIAYRDYPILYGGLTKLLSWGGNLLAIFEHGICIIPVNEKALIPTDDGTLIAVGAVKVIPDTLQMLSDLFGSLWSESIIESKSWVYGVDTVAKKIWRTNGALLDIISDFKVQKFLNDNISLGERELTPIIGVRNVKTHYNAFKHDILFTFYDNLKGFEECVWNLCYNELLDTFITFYSWIPSYSANIDNIFFTYDRNSSKWITKLGLSNKFSSSADGITLDTVNIDEWKHLNAIRKVYLNVSNRILPENVHCSYFLERDNFRNDRYFSIGTDTDGDFLYITDHDYILLKRKLLTDVPQIPVILLNLGCEITVQTTEQATNSGDPLNWERYFSYNLGNYLSQVAITFENVLNRKESYETYNNILYFYPKLKTDFWKHGLAGIIDIKDPIKPCFWYGKLHPFEYSFIVGNSNAEYKLFTNMQLITNNIKPESIHYEIIGDSYAFAGDKKNMYFRQEATKALFLYNGSDMLYDHDVFDVNKGYLPEYYYSSKYIETTNTGLYLRDKSAVSDIYKATIFPLIYLRRSTFNEVEDFYRQIIAPHNKDYPNVSGGEVINYIDLLLFNLVNHVKFRDIKEVGRMRGNAQYVNDKWEVQISPFITYQRNEKWNNSLPPIILNNMPEDLTILNKQDVPEELSINCKDYILGKNNIGYSLDDIDIIPWEKIANTRKECKLMDKYMKIKIRYTGDLLVLVSAINTIYNTMR